jgi:hypothetical protein
MHFIKDNHKNLLIITTSGGGGHLQAANAKIAEENLKNPSIHVTTYDIVARAGGKWLGKFMIRIWDKTQRKGSVRGLELFAALLPAFDIIFWLPVFFHILHSLFKYHIDHVVDTQPLCLSAITAAVRLYRYFKKNTIFIEKILTELPTDYASHYLTPIKRLRENSRNLICLVTTQPLLTENETAENFWQKHCGLSTQKISYGDFPIRPSFKKYQKKPKLPEPLSLIIKLKNTKENALLKNLLDKGHVKGRLEENSLHITIQPNHKVTTLMLGSQTVETASLGYVKSFIEMIQGDPNKDLLHYFFVFCSQKSSESTSLQEQIYNLITTFSDYPSNLMIIPMSAQEDDVIAPLYFRSDATLTKAGGVTAMELIAVAQGKIWIHHEDKPTSLEKLLSNNPFFTIHSYKGMPKWEYGNAAYLEEIKGAEMVTPETFSQASRPYLCS